MAALNESGVKSLLEHLQGDFKAISGEAKKKLPAVKEVKARLIPETLTIPYNFFVLYMVITVFSLTMYYVIME